MRMPDRSRVLVVGTTPDYIDWIRRCNPERALFLTDPGQRQRTDQPQPEPHEEILANLTDGRQVRQAVRQHLLHHRMRINAVACFD